MVNERVAYYPAGQRALAVRALLITGALFLAWSIFVVAPLQGQDPDRSKLHEPVFRVEKTEEPTTASDAPDGQTPSRLGPSDRLAAKAAPEPTLDNVGPGTAPRETNHPLDPALAIAREALAHIEATVEDYCCTLVKRERVNGVLMDHEFMTCKVRHPSKQGGENLPFSVYLKFRKPDSMSGREVIYVEGRNAGKIIAHEGGFRGRFIPTVHLLPTSALALRGNRYPITEIGIMTLTRRLIEKAERDRSVGDCQVRLVDGAKVTNRLCTMVEVTHPQEKPGYDFHMARVFLDSELKMPIRYEAYGWPTSAGGRPPLLEEYTYTRLKLNTGISDKDFDPKNPSYRF